MFDLKEFGPSSSFIVSSNLDTIKKEFSSNDNVIVVDRNHSNDVIKEMAILAKNNDVPFYHFSPQPMRKNNYLIHYVDTYCYNPLLGYDPVSPYTIVDLKEYSPEAQSYKESVYKLANAIYIMINQTDSNYLSSDKIDSDKRINVHQNQLGLWMDAIENIDTLYYGYKETLKDFRVQEYGDVSNTVALAKKPASELNTALRSILFSLQQLENETYKINDVNVISDKFMMEKYFKKPSIVLFSLTGKNDISSTMLNSLISYTSNYADLKSRNDRKDRNFQFHLVTVSDDK